mmetsp:Transcript_57935/g.137989  ORF Transcript_57935/g.137989 Transcript_57935/m.137989 type:complete len:203 (-) Transcript_57935:246-854(-)
MFPAEGDDRAHGVKALLNNSGGLGIAALCLILNFLNSLSHDSGTDTHKWQCGAHHQCNEPTHAKGTAKATNECGSGHDSVSELVSKSILNLLKIVIDLRWQCCNFLGVVPTDILVEHRVKVEHPELEGLLLRKDFEKASLQSCRQRRTRTYQHHGDAKLLHLRHHCIHRRLHLLRAEGLSTPGAFAHAVDEVTENNAHQGLR